MNASGTSVAAPHVTGGIAGLKSLFPNLSFQDLRIRVLHTANRTGRYADAEVYGQGLLDLDTASRPVGGTSLTTATSDDGRMHTTNNTGIQVGSSFAHSVADENVLIFDGYQQAPFVTKLGSFVSERKGLVSLDDIGLDEKVSRPAGTEREDHQLVRLFTGGPLKTNLSAGMEVEHGSYWMPTESFGMALGVEAGDGTLELAWATREKTQARSIRGGIDGWQPETVLAATFVPEEGNASFGASFAMGLGAPGGISGRGSLETQGQAIDVGYRRTIHLGNSAWASLGSRLVHLVTNTPSGVVHKDNTWIAGLTSKVTFELGQRTWLTTKLEMQRALGRPGTWFRAASTIDESGAIGYRDIRIDDGSLNDIDRASVQLVHEVSENARIGFGIAAARDRAGTKDAIAGVRYQLSF